MENGRLKRAAEVNTIGRCDKRSKNVFADEVILSSEDHPNLPDEVILATEDHPNLPDEVILATEDHPHLPDELILENIVTRVPSPTLMRCSCVSKLWYKSILHNSRFATTYFEQQSKKDPPFIFYNLNVPKDEDDSSSSKFPDQSYIFRFEEDHEKKTLNKTRSKVGCAMDVLLYDEKLVIGDESIRLELVGNCNGLVCLSRSFKGVMIVNPTRQEKLVIYYPPIIKNGGCIVCGYGFGFDSLTHEYKVVIIVVKKSVFKCLVFTLGTNSWRETSTTIPLSPARTTSFYKSAIFCGGALFWRTKSSSSDNNNMLLLSFDLHDDEFQVIPLPAECASSSSLLEQQYQIIDPLLEFKGSPCVARLEKTILGGGNCTSYCYKVHLHILKEYSKVGRRNEQVWIEETFDVIPHSFTDLLSPAAPCFIKDGTNTFRTPPNRITISSDGRVFLYCFLAGQVVQAYDLQTKRLNMANCGNYARFFLKKKHSEVYDQIDYHLSGGHIENFMSMMAFIPKGRGEGAPPRLGPRELLSILRDKQRTPPLVGYLRIQHQKPADIYLL